MVTNACRARATFLLLPFAFGACTGTSAWTAAESEAFVAMQQAVNAQLALGAAALLENAMVALPEGNDLDDLDLALNVAPALPAEPGGMSLGQPVAGSAVDARVIYTMQGAQVAMAGHVLSGFDSVSDLAVDRDRGIVLLATRRGVQTVTTAQGVWEGHRWRPDLVPQVSTDGSCFVFVEEGFLNDRSMIAPTADPTQGKPLDFGCRIHWPVWPGRDGTRIRAIVENEGRIEIRDNGQVVAIAEDYAKPYFDVALDQLRVHLVTGGKTRVLIGDRLLPALDSYRQVAVSADGTRHLALGRDGERDHLVYDGNSVLVHAAIERIALAAGGGTWACSLQEGGRWYVARPDGRIGPMAEIVDLTLAPDGGALAVQTRGPHGTQWAVDGALVQEFEAVRDLRLLPGKAGLTFVGRDGEGWWLVVRGAAGGAGERKDGPWDEVGRCVLADDGRHVMALTRRGGQAHRRVLPLP